MTSIRSANVSALSAFDDLDNFDADDSGAMRHVIAALDQSSVPQRKGAVVPRDARRARKLKTVTFSVDDLLQGLVSRQRFEDEIERLIGILDAADPDPDLEETGDLEPSLGAYRPGDPYDGELDKSDDEPSLGSLDRQVDQRLWNRGSTDDAELDESDHEPSSGSPGHGEDDSIFGHLLQPSALIGSAVRP